MVAHDEDTDTQLSLIAMPPLSPSRRWALRVVAGPLAGAVFEATKDLTIGRAPTAHIRCSDPTVSRDHAAVRRHGEQLFIEDLGSRNGTLVEGARIERATALREGCRIDLGALSLRVVREDESEIRESKRLYDAATCDPVTGIHNRSYFDAQLARAIEAAHGERKPLALLLVDLDHFKGVNDQFGHLTGDAALRSVGQAIASGVRPHDTVARWGGEEFVVLLPGTSSLEGALIADRIRRQIEGIDTTPLGMDRGLSVSIGVASEPEHGGWSSAELVSAADSALYRAKTEGRNRVYAYSEEMELETGLIRKKTAPRSEDSTVMLPRRA